MINKNINIYIERFNHPNVLQININLKKNLLVIITVELNKKFRTNA
jgi:hypothetical protein